MAVLARSSLRAGMDILVLMTAEAGGRSTIEFKGGGVALEADQVGMRTCQGKDRAVIKSGKFPAGSGVAVFTDSAFTPCMFIILLMAAKTGGRRAFNRAFDVALCALN